MLKLMDSGNMNPEMLDSKSLAKASSQKVLAGNGAERVKKNRTTIVAITVVILFHSIGSLIEDSAWAEAFFSVFISKILTLAYLSKPTIFSGLQGSSRILTPVAL